jgi:hypothetical protein
MTETKTIKASNWIDDTTEIKYDSDSMELVVNDETYHIEICDFNYPDGYIEEFGDDGGKHVKVFTSDDRDTPAFEGFYFAEDKTYMLKAYDVQRSSRCVFTAAAQIIMNIF